MGGISTGKGRSVSHKTTVDIPSAVIVDLSVDESQLEEELHQVVLVMWMNGRLHHGQLFADLAADGKSETRTFELCRSAPMNLPVDYNNVVDLANRGLRRQSMTFSKEEFHLAKVLPLQLNAVEHTKRSSVDKPMHLCEELKESFHLGAHAEGEVHFIIISKAVHDDTVQARGGSGNDQETAMNRTIGLLTDTCFTKIVSLPVKTTNNTDLAGATLTAIHGSQDALKAEIRSYFTRAYALVPEDHKRTVRELLPEMKKCVQGTLSYMLCLFCC